MLAEEAKRSTAGGNGADFVAGGSGADFVAGFGGMAFGFATDLLAFGWAPGLGTFDCVGAMLPKKSTGNCETLCTENAAGHGEIDAGGPFN